MTDHTGPTALAVVRLALAEDADGLGCILDTTDPADLPALAAGLTALVCEVWRDTTGSDLSALDTYLAELQRQLLIAEAAGGAS